MAAFNKINQFVEDLAHAVHNLSTAQLVAALTTNANVPVAANETLSDLTTIDHTNLSSRNFTTVSSGQTAGTYSFVLDDLVLTASGTVPTFRHVAIYNDTPTSPADPLICWYSHTTDVDLLTGETFTIAFSSSLFTLA